jgi:hypothetical protein
MGTGRFSSGTGTWLVSFSFTAALAVGSGCMAADEPPAEPVAERVAPILGGRAATAGEFPTVVAVRVGSGGLCTGTLVDAEWVVTAAHCLTPLVVELPDQATVTAMTTVRFDSTSAFGGGMAIKAAQTIPHPQFNPYALGDNDIGLIKLATPVTRAVSTLNRRAEAAPPGTAVTMVGYGQSSTSNQNAVGVELVVDKTTADCASVTLPIPATNAKLLCFPQTDGKGKCHGDSGGPSFATIGGKQVLVGVTSFGDQPCLTGGADTRVDAELDFIDTHIPALRCASDGVCVAGCGAGGLPVDDDCCTSDAQCTSEQVCDEGECIPAPFSPMGLGDDCQEGNECHSGLCVAGPDGKRCTELCTVGASADCPAFFECLSAGAGSQGACWPEGEAPGDCSVSEMGGRPDRGPSGVFYGAVLAGALLLLLSDFRRRRR